MVRAISKVLCGEDSVLNRVICDLGKTENDTDKYPNIIEDYETTKKILTEEYF